MATKIYSVRFDPALMARVDAQGVGRSEFIRAAVEAALVGSPSAVASPGVAVEKVKISVPLGLPPKKNPSRSADDAAVLEVIRGGRFSSRQVEQRMGWLGLRYSNAERRLLSTGVVTIVDGILVAT